MGFVFVKYIIACSRALENEDGTFDFEGVFDMKNLEFVPEEFKFDLVIAMEHSLTRREDRNIILKILDSNGDSVNDFSEFTLELNSTKKNSLATTVSLINLSRFHVKKEGVYSIVACYNNDIISKYDILFVKEDNNEQSIISSESN